MIRTRRTTVGRELERLLRDGVQSARGDARLLERYLDDRDESAFEILVDRHGPMVLSLCRRYLRDPRDVEDAFQATFMILVRKGSSLRDKASLSSWLYGVAYRVALRARANLLKRRQREGEPDGLIEAVAPAARPVDDSLEVLDAELSRLPEKYRAPLILCYLEGRTHDQAAVELGWPVGTVRSRMATGRAVLASRLTRRGLDASACLALLRPDYLVTSTILPAITSASTSWPATALAQGVLAAMFISQWKWVGLATTAFAVLAATAGVGARAIRAPGGPESLPATAQESKPSEAPQADKPSPQPDEAIDIGKREPRDDVQARLAEMERKIDRMTELLKRLEGRVGNPAVRAVDMRDYLPVGPETPGVPPPPPGAPPSPVPSAAPDPSPAPSASPIPSPSLAPGPPPSPDPSPTPNALPSSTSRPPSAQPGPVGYIEDTVRFLNVSPPATHDRPGGPPPLDPEPTPTQRPAPASFTVEDPAPSRSFPFRANRPAPATQDLLSDRDGGGVRVIQAQLLNLYADYKYLTRLNEKKAGLVSDKTYRVPIDQARILVARLREMEDEVEYEVRNIDRLRQELESAKKEGEMISQRFEELDRIPSDKAPPRNQRLLDRMNRDYQRAIKLEDELRAQQSQLDMKKIRLPKVQELIQWAEEHFKELKD